MKILNENEEMAKLPELMLTNEYQSRNFQKYYFAEMTKLGYLKMMKMMIDNGFKVPYDTCMKIACKNGLLDVVKFLIEGKYYTYKPCEYCAVTLAFEHNHVDILKYLIDNNYIKYNVRFLLKSIELVMNRKYYDSLIYISTLSDFNKRKIIMVAKKNQIDVRDIFANI
ncbi:putative ankyrin repeat protein [Powai lake megavirus]|uniref:Putative ankyrin repeat protein n=1 Tax=Powai lake megavirus TaxID=1842663 RepID=A0A167R136_9VIRU|nr:putative ankyrin repeat protein [Powai lake megavirus]ANB50187.1 putative ankyrin repeat protein [Powai lake megavirus]